MTTRHTSNARLLKLAEFLEKLPKNVLNMHTWVRAGDEKFLNRIFTEKGYMKADLEPKVVKECGYAACAVGWAGSIPSFRKAGFQIVAEEYGSVGPKYKGYQSWGAVERFFGLASDEAAELFGGRTTTPKQVAKEIKAFVKTRA